LLVAIGEVNAAISQILTQEELLQAFLNECVEVAGFHFAALQLVNRERDIIESVAGINVPWTAEAVHFLDGDDIQAEIVRTKQTLIVSEYHERFDRHLYEKYQHERFVRIFVPLSWEGDVIGTIEAGFDRSKVPGISADARAALEALISEWTPQIVASLLPGVLHRIIRNAIDLIGADSGSIHICPRAPGSQSYIHRACAGRIDEQFLDLFPPGEQGIGALCLGDGKARWIDDPTELSATHGNIYAPATLWDRDPKRYPRDEGVRAIAAFPLNPGGSMQGLVYVHFWSPHQFEPGEIDMMSLFSSQTSKAVVNAETYQKLRDRARLLSSLSLLGNSALSNTQMATLLPGLAETALRVLQADFVSIFEYDSRTGEFVTPPDHAGKPRIPDAMTAPIRRADTPKLVMKDGKSLFVRDAKSSPILCNRDKPDQSPGYVPFVLREDIASVAALVLRFENEPVGLMFVNYRRARGFSDLDKRVIENFASYAAMAIGRVRITTRMRIDQLTALTDITFAVEENAPVEGVLSQLLDKCVAHFQLRPNDGYATIQLVDPATEVLEIRAHRFIPEDTRLSRLPMRDLDLKGVTLDVARQGLPRLINDTGAEESYLEMVPGMKSELAVPIQLGRRLLGVLNIEKRRPSAFDAADLAMLAAFARQAATALRNTETFSRLHALRISARELHAKSPLFQLGKTIVTQAQAVSEADRIIFVPYNPDVGRFQLEQLELADRSAVSWSGSDLWWRCVAATGDDLLRETGVQVMPIGADAQMAAGQCMRVVLRNTVDDSQEPLALLWMGYPSRTRPTMEDLTLTRWFVHEAATALSTAIEIERFHKQERLKTIDLFGAYLSHELTDVLGTLPRNLTEAEEALGRKQLDKVSAAIDRLWGDAGPIMLVLRAVSRFNRGILGTESPVDVNAVLKKVLKHFRIPDRIRVDFMPGPTRVTKCNEDYLVIAIDNVVSNAIKALPGSGTLMIRSRDEERQIVIEIEDRRAVGATRTDAGQAPEREGLGIGLFLVQQSLSRLGGTMVTRAKDTGTSVAINIPLHGGAR
jgi:GAF domain-containing protein/signal transduction histidine kinase